MASIDRLYAYAEERNKGQSQEQAAKTVSGNLTQNQNGTARSSQTKTSLTGQNRLYEYAKLRNKGLLSSKARLIPWLSSKSPALLTLSIRVSPSWLTPPVA